MNWEVGIDIYILHAYVFSGSVVSNSVIPWTVAHQAPLFTEFWVAMPSSRGSSQARD